MAFSSRSGNMVDLSNAYIPVEKLNDGYSASLLICLTRDRPSLLTTLRPNFSFRNRVTKVYISNVHTWPNNKLRSFAVSHNPCDVKCEGSVKSNYIAVNTSCLTFALKFIRCKILFAEPPLACSAEIFLCKNFNVIT